MNLKNKISKILLVAVLVMNMGIIPIAAANDVVTASVEPRLNNIASATLSLGFDMKNVAYCEVGLSPYSHCTGFDGMMRLFDSAGNQLKSWSVSDYVEPYSIEKTWQCEYGKTYTVTFQGYAYGSGTMYDEINLSVTGTCED